MAEAAKVRLVRCPKCENLLPELPDFSIYQCGGCGAVLKAKKKGILEDGLSDMSGDVKGRGTSEEDGAVKASDVEMESAKGIEGGKVDRLHNEGLVSNGSSTSQADISRETLSDSERNRIRKERVRRLGNVDEDYTSYSHGLVRNRNQGKNLDFNVDGPQAEPLRSRPVMNQWGPTRRSNDSFLYHDEGQSSYETNSYYEQGQRSRYRGHDLDGRARIETLENGRADLLRKLDELKDQITRSCEVAENPKERMFQESSLPSSLGANKQPLSSGFVPYSDMYGSRVIDPYPLRGYPHEFLHYGNKPEILGRPPRQQYMQPPYHEHYPPHYGDPNHDLFMLQRHENFFHQPACSCVHCCDNNRHNPSIADLHNRRAQNEPSNRNFHQDLNPLPRRLQGNGTGNFHRQSLTLNPNDLDLDKDGFNYHRPRKLVVAHRSGRMSYPIFGGAPFIACSNCFELLKLSRKHISLEKDQQKVKCGACSSIIVFELGNKGFVAPVSTHVDQLPTEIDEGSSGTVEENVRYWNEGSHSANMNTFSNDYDESDHKFSPTDKKSNSGDSEKQLDRLSSTSSLSGDEPTAENKLSRKNDSSPSSELHLTRLKSISDHDSSPKEYPDQDLVANRFDKLNKSRRAEEEKASIARSTSQQSSVKDAAVATVIDVPLNEFSNSYISQDSADTNREDIRKVNKGGESFFAGLIKKSFKDFRKSNQVAEVGGSQVFVNGHFIPDRVVKKAEKLAGPIQPGDYWYDRQAGFWGVMGHPCLGIIMPNIEELNYPMPDNCAAGNTGVFVNGRELHQKDLDLLSSRGLPVTSHRSYIVEINGKVVDEQTGEELDCLGKLAPTVEKAKHGFGMKVPRFLARSQS